jgi:hypothetical protein
MIERMEGKCKLAGLAKGDPVSAVSTPCIAALPFRVLDAGALGMIYTIWHSMRVDVLPIISTDELLTLDSIKAFEGLFAWLAPNRSRPRAWMLRFIPLPLDAEGQGQS